METLHDEYAPVNLVCSSLRQHPVWASAVTHLLQTDGRRWKEAHLVTHDIALSILDPHTERYEIFRLLLISSADINNPQILSRIQHLSQLDATNTALVFLLQPHDTEEGPPAMQAFMELHIRLTATQQYLPIIPLSTLPDLPTALQAFQSSLAASRAHHRTRLPTAAVDAARDILPFCAIAYNTTTNNNNSSSSSTGTHNTVISGRSSGRMKNDEGTKSAALSRQAVESLSQGFFSFRELVQGISTAEGQSGVRMAVGDAEGEGMVAFWGWEFEVGGGTTSTG
ncbi:hypothetical protein N657DRAFT_677188 [Parathielavia appendiculata]|uniref:Uncharacterized protein n=1 Tax=Parathielavia appendiculata TaxID=2587402 RepID=A0AAN6Z8E0_9PEZI|nr:hypothetical protein N657DRAFT_677188 [Parathielavia appendiculata]